MLRIDVANGCLFQPFQQLLPDSLKGLPEQGVVQQLLGFNTALFFVHLIVSTN